MSEYCDLCEIFQEFFRCVATLHCVLQLLGITANVNRIRIDSVSHNSHTEPKKDACPACIQTIYTQLVTLISW